MSRTPDTLTVAFPTPQFTLLDGHAELAVAEAVTRRVSRPHKVTAILETTISHLNQQAVNNRTVRQLACAGREWLLHKVASRFYSTEWYETHCHQCGVLFDLHLSLQEIPRTLPAAGFPTIQVHTSLGWRKYEVPNGLFEEALAARRLEDPRRVFAATCGLVAEAEMESKQLLEEDLVRIDQVLEQVAPEIADSVEVDCPECGHLNQAQLDPLSFAFPHWHDVLADVHLLAKNYSWSETTVLDLPQHRRRAYVSLIHRGVQGARYS